MNDSAVAPETPRQGGGWFARVDRDFRAPALALLVSGVMHLTLFRHQLRHDDFVICFESVHLPFWKYLWTPYGGHILPTHRILYSLFRPLVGLSPFPYFAVAFVTHLANVFLLYRTLRSLTARASWSAFWAAVWGASLPTVGTLVLFSTYGQAQAGFFALLVLQDLAAFHARGDVPSVGRVFLWALSLLLSALSAGIGTSTAFGIYVTAAVLLRGPGARRVAFQLVVSAVGILVLYTSLQRHLGDATPVDASLGSFTFQAFVLLFAQGIVDLFLPAIFAIGSGEGAVGPLAHVPVQTVGALTLGAAALLLLPVVVSLRAVSVVKRRRSLVFFVVALGNYALIALGRTFVVHAFGGSPLSLAQAIRYHYFNPVFLTVAFAVALAEWDVLAVVLRRGGARQAIMVWAIFTFGSSFAVAQGISRADSDQAEWARRDLLERVLREVRKSPAGATVLVPNEEYAPTRFLSLVGVPAARFPNLAAAWLSENRGEEVEGRHVRFVEQDQAVLRALRQEPDSPANQLIVGALDGGRKAPRMLALGEAGVRAFVVSGIYEEDDKGYAWTARSFTVRLGVSPELAARGGILQVSAYVPDEVIVQHRTVRLSARAGGVSLAPRTLDAAGVIDVDFEVPAGALAAGEVEVEVEVDKRFTSPGDDRELGILVHRFELRP